MVVHTIKSSADFDRQLKLAGSKLVVIDFFASWCGPCKEIDPKVKELSKKYSDKTVVLKVNVDRFEDIADKYRVRSMPTFVFIRDKRKVGGFTGADEEKLARRMSKA